MDFGSSDEAQAALGKLRRKKRDVQLAKQCEQDLTNVFFANLPADVDEQRLNDLLKGRFEATVVSTQQVARANLFKLARQNGLT